ncbi:MAG: modification methylase [Ignavibacteria bacterium]|nr:modification methylase [Ignavibacteria bacterium]
MIKSPLRYPGGKSRAVDLIATLIPKFTEFREPFVGGGSIFIYLKQKFPNRKFWINDLYYELFKFWEMSSKDIDSVIEKIYELRNKFSDGKELHRFLIDNIKQYDDLYKAAAFFIFNRITFSGTTESGGFSQQAFTGRFTESSIKRLIHFGQVIKNTKITNLDFQEVIEAEGENVFIFLDPPYYSASKSALYGKNGVLHKGFDHIRFAEVMKNCRHNWLITYDDSEYIRNLFSFAHIIPWELTYGMRNITTSSNQNGKELFISNYLKKLPRDIIKENQMVLIEPKIEYDITKKKKNIVEIKESHKR